MKTDFCCAQMQHAVESNEVPIVYTPKFREYGIEVLDGGDSFILLRSCPWCCRKLPESLRQAWFQKLEGLGIDPFGDKVPPEFSDERWYSTAV